MTVYPLGQFRAELAAAQKTDPYCKDIIAAPQAQAGGTEALGERVADPRRNGHKAQIRAEQFVLDPRYCVRWMNTFGCR